MPCPPCPHLAPCTVCRNASRSTHQPCSRLLPPLLTRTPRIPRTVLPPPCSYIIGLFLAPAIQSLCENQNNFLLYSIGTRMRNSLMAAIYRKCLRLSNSALQVGAAGCTCWVCANGTRQFIAGLCCTSPDSSAPPTVDGAMPSPLTPCPHLSHAVSSLPSPHVSTAGREHGQGGDAHVQRRTEAAGVYQGVGAFGERATRGCASDCA